MSDKIWVSPDNRLRKIVQKKGLLGRMPSENTICMIEINYLRFNNGISSEYITELSQFPFPSHFCISTLIDRHIEEFVQLMLAAEFYSKKYSITLTIGEANTSLDRGIDICLQTMLKTEISLVTLYFPKSDTEINFQLKLCDFEHRGFVIEWSVDEKLSIAQKHKEKGIELFKNNRFLDASHRFNSGLRLLQTIPIPVDLNLMEVNFLAFKDILNRKVNFYNNLASCYIKEKIFDTAIQLCNVVLSFEQNNVKALYKRGVAFAETKDFEKAKQDFTEVLKLDADNEAAKAKLQLVNSKIRQAEADFAPIVKKMFR